MPADLEDAADASESPRAAVERDEDAADVDTDSQAERVVVSAKPLTVDRAPQ